MSFFVFENKNDEIGHLSVAKGLVNCRYIFSLVLFIFCMKAG